MSNQNRETWLQTAVEVIRDGVFVPRNATIPEFKISVGLPHARNQREIKMQIFRADQTADRIPQVYINPLVGDTETALSLIYGACSQLARSNSGAGVPILGLPQGSDLQQALKDIGAVLGEYPQAALLLPDVKKQDTRMLKMKCPKCGYTARATAKWIRQGLPTCHDGAKFDLLDKLEPDTSDDLPF